MTEFPDTSDSLISQVRDPGDRAAWDRFEQLYRPVIFRIARSRGLQESDSLDIVQQVLMSVASAIGTYRRREDGPPFRHWLSRITRNATLVALTRGPRDKATGGSSALRALSVVPSLGVEQTEQLIETEYRREIYARAAARVRREVEDSTWLAFELTVLLSISVENAARSLGLSVGSVYAARSRVVRRLRNAIQELEEEDGCGGSKEGDKYDEAE